MKALIHLISKNWLVITTILLVTITTLSLWPVDKLPSVPGTDKTHHLIAYAALTLPIALAKPKYLYLILLVFIAWSGAIELIQPYVNRYGEWLDMLANTSGVILGFLLGHLLGRYFLTVEK